MSLNGELKIGAGHPFAIVGDADKPSATAVRQHIDAARAGVERIFDELLHDACRPFNHLACGDAVDDSLG
jgi:hypothetical protein